MALRIVSASGGNWNATTSWVGGVVPIAGDNIKADATSGSLTLNVSTANLSGADFTGYTGTFSLGSNGFYLTSLPNQGLTFSSSMNISYTQGFIYVNGSTLNIYSAGKKYNLIASAQSTITPLDDLYLDCTLGTNPYNHTFLGTYSVYWLSSTYPAGAFTNIRMAGNNNKFIFRPPSSFTTATTPIGAQGWFRLDPTAPYATNMTLANTAANLSRTFEISSGCTFGSTGTMSSLTCLPPNNYSGFFTQSFIVAPDINISLFQLGAPASTTAFCTMSYYTTGLVNAATFYISHSNSVWTHTLRFLSGGFSCSNISITNTGTGIGPDVQVSSDFSIICSTASFYGRPQYGIAAPSQMLFRSLTPSVPATITIKDCLNTFLTSYTDIINNGKPQYALSQNSITLTRTTGFISTPETSQTFIN